MFTLFIPYVVASALGFGDGGSPPTPIAEVPLAEGPAVAAAPGKGPAAAVADAAPGLAPLRAPEPQLPTGQFTTAVEIRPILDMMRPQWIGLREFEGEDLLYFTNLASWRCGLWDISYGINGAPAETPLLLEPCHDGTAQPNALTDPVGYAVFFAFPLQSIERVDVEITYDDGTTDTAVYSRASVLQP